MLYYIVYTTTSKRFVIFTCRDFKLSWNTTAPIQSNCRNFSCNSHKRTDIVTLNKQLLISELFFTTCFSSWNFIPLEYGGPQLSRQKQKHHGKTKNLTAKTEYLMAKPSTSQQKQNSFGFAVGICFCRGVFGFCCEVFGFTVRFLVLLWGILFLSWGFREVFVFGVRLLVLPWGILYLPWGFWFCRDSSGPPYWNLKTCHCLFYIHYFHTDVYPTKFCITIASNFSWVLQSSREKSKTMVMQNFGG